MQSGSTSWARIPPFLYAAFPVTLLPTSFIIITYKRKNKKTCKQNANLQRDATK